jgi:hypothetical protein
VTQPGPARPDPRQADTPERTAWQHATDHTGPATSPDLLTEIQPAAQEPLLDRAQARLGRGTARAWTKGTAFVRGDGLDLTDRGGRWLILGIACYAIDRALALGSGATVVLLGVTGATWVVTAWRYGGPHGEKALTDVPAPGDEQDPEPGPLSHGDQDEITPAALGPGPVAQLPAGSTFRITADPGGGTLVHVLGGDERPVPDDARWAVAALSQAQEAEKALRAALAAPKVSLPVTDVTGGPTAHGQRYQITLKGGATVADVIGKLSNLESAWGVPHGGAVYAAPDEAGTKNQVILTRLDTDPLTAVQRTRRLEFGTVSVKDPVHIGNFEDGTPDHLYLQRRNVGNIAANRAGKSTLHWNTLNHLTACRDAVYWLIDLQGSAALRTWAPTAGQTAWTLEDARTLLRAGFALAQYRAGRLGSDAEAFIHSDLETLDVNHDPTPTDPALVILIDEGSLLAEDRECVSLLIEIMRTGPKADVTVDYANQRGTDDATGSASLRKEFGEKFMMRCEETDVDQFLGRDLRQSGWAPHRITLQGVYYHLNLIDGGRQAPRRARTTWPDPGEMKAGIRAAIGRRPRFSPSTSRALPYAVQTETFPEALAAIICQARDAGQDRIGVADLTERLTTRSPSQWARADVTAHLHEHAVTPRESMRLGPGDKKGNGYLLTDLDRAAEDEPDRTA